ncbi:MAG: hypothetical protein MMC23_002684 [Stictis urceolatum]|nr:hypothetical protein [Stictis urceolata]
MAPISSLRGSRGSAKGSRHVHWPDKVEQHEPVLLKEDVAASEALKQARRVHSRIENIDESLAGAKDELNASKSDLKRQPESKDDHGTRRVLRRVVGIDDLVTESHEDLRKLSADFDKYVRIDKHRELSDEDREIMKNLQLSELYHHKELRNARISERHAEQKEQKLMTEIKVLEQEASDSQARVSRAEDRSRRERCHSIYLENENEDLRDHIKNHACSKGHETKGQRLQRSQSERSTKDTHSNVLLGTIREDSGLARLQLRSTHDRLRESERSHDDLCALYNKDVGSLRRENAEQRQEIQELKHTIGDVRDRNKGLQDQTEHAIQDSKNFDTENAQLHRGKYALRLRNGDLGKRNHALQTENESLRGDNSRLRQTMKEQAAKIKDTIEEMKRERIERKRLRSMMNKNAEAMRVGTERLNRHRAGHGPVVVKFHVRGDINQPRRHHPALGRGDIGRRIVVEDVS